MSSSKIKNKDKIKLIVSDFDGVFTDGCVYISDDYKESKKINFKDIMGVSIAIKNAYKVVIISGEKTAAIDFLQRKFPALESFQGIRAKADVLMKVMEKYSLTPAEVIYIGDDINDIDCLNIVDNAFTVPDAVEKVKKVNNINILEAKSGDGAFREVVDYLVE